MPRLATSSVILAALFAAGCEASPTESEADTAWAGSDASTAGNDAALTDDDAVAPNADAAPEPVADDDYDLTEVTIARLLAAQAKGTLDAAEILEWHLARLQAYDNAGPGLRSLRRVSPDVQQQAEAQHDPDSVGPLRGIVVTVKDNIDVAGMPTTAGATALLDNIPQADATVVQRLRAAGAVLLGKTAMTELAAYLAYDLPPGFSAEGGYVCNPYDPRRVDGPLGSCVLSPAGSSSGAAVGVAAGLAVAAIGTETSGSIIKPASANQIVGIRPTVGLVSRTGVIPISMDLDSPGPLARTVADAATVLGVITGYDPLDPATATCLQPGHCLSDYRPFLDSGALKGARIGMPIGLFWSDLTSEEVERMYDVTRALLDAGATVEAVWSPDEMDAKAERTPCSGKYDERACSMALSYAFKRDLDQYLSGCAASQAVHSLADLIEWNNDHMDQIHFGQQLLDEAMPFDLAPDSDDTLRYQADLAEDTANARGSLDAMLAGPDGQTGTSDDQDALLFAATESGRILGRAGYPAIAVPAGLISRPDGPARPFGVAFVGRAFSEGHLIGVAYAYEQATHHRKPPESTPPLQDALVPLP
ncbi:MAG: amidase family protein [Myxococcota bacterium]